ncbi:MAG TPA: hypothetical protein VEU74_10395 [Gemmatimonadales bacterium]|nr:hypothetical protein [Gemmatimonadales bacterium]
MMTSPELENLVRLGHLKREPCSQRDFDNLVKSGTARLNDAANPAISIEGRFDLAYNAAHALALAALRHGGYRSENRYVVFQALAHTLGLSAETWRVLAKAHERRNLAEYDGVLDMDERLLQDVMAAAQVVLKGVRGLPPLEGPKKKS